MLEVLVHLEVDSIPPPFQLMRIQVPDGLPHSAWPNSARSDLSSRSEEHTSELQSLMRTSYAVFCFKKKNTQQTTIDYPHLPNKCKTTNSTYYDDITTQN